MGAKLSRVDFRSSEADKIFIKEAADYTGESMTNFILSASLEKAEKVLEKQNIRRLGSEESLKFYSLMDSLETANTKLKLAASEFKNKYGK